MITNEICKQFYDLMPRFVENHQVEYINSRFLSSIERQFEWNGRRFSFVITPAMLHNQYRGGKHYFPGIKEQIVEEALRHFAVKEYSGFFDEQSVLVISLDKLSEKISDAFQNHVLTADEIEKALEILADTRYRIINEFVETAFYSIKELSRMNIGGSIHYRINFSRMFLGKCEIYDCVFDLTGRDVIVD